MSHQRRSAIAVLCAALSTHAQDISPHLQKAREFAGKEFLAVEQAQCREPGTEEHVVGSAGRINAEPKKIFDNLYYIGLMDVSAWAVSTADGVVLLDALFTDTVESTLLPGMRKLGLNPAAIKYVVVTHAHADHFGGARYFQQKYGARIVMSATDWDAVAEFTGAGKKGLKYPGHPVDETPKRDIVATDGQTLTVGGTTFTFYLTPGHTPGTLSVVFPVKDHGTPHVAALWGGIGYPLSPDRREQYVRSVEHFSAVASTAKVDVELLNHPYVDTTLQRAALLKGRQEGQPNPFVIGQEGFQRFMGILGECAQVAPSAAQHLN